MNAILSPSLLSANLANMAGVCRQLESEGVSWLHLDIMDGMFVPNITFGPCVIKAIRPHSTLFFDVHLMINEPERYVDAFANAGADMLVIHYEAALHPQKTLAHIKERGLKSGLSLNPGSNFASCRWLLSYIDLILIMGVNPGFSGQKFIPETTEKVRECRNFLNKNDYNYIAIEVDGGVNLQNAEKLVEAGADALVSGSAFFCGNDMAYSVKLFSQKTALNNLPPLSLERISAWTHREREST